METGLERIRKLALSFASLSALLLLPLSCSLFSPTALGTTDDQLASFSIKSALASIASGKAADSQLSIAATIPAASVSRGLLAAGGRGRGLTLNKLATHVGLFAVPPDSYWSSNLVIKSLVPVHADGSFSLPFLPSDSANSVVMLVNENATNPLELVVGFLAIPSDAGGALVELPLDKASTGLALGALAKGEDATEFNSPLKVGDVASAFNSSLPSLETKALFDNGAKRVENAFVNASNVGYSFKYFWYSQERLASLAVSASDPSQYWAYSGYGFEVNLPYDAATSSSLSSSNMGIYLYPPSAVAASNAGSRIAGDSGDPFTSGDGFLSSGYSAFQDAQGNYIPTNIKLMFGDYIPSFTKGASRLFTDVVPAGMWSVHIGNAAPLGVFDFSLIDPMRPNGRPAVFLPSVSCSTIAGKYLYTVSFSYFDKSGKIQQATLSDFESLASNFSLYFGKGGSGLTNMGSNVKSVESYQVTPGVLGQPIVDFAVTPTDILAVHYNMYGVEYFFVFNP